MADKITATKNSASASSEKAGLEVDVVMFLLIIINLLFFVFDWLFTFAFFRHIVQQIYPGFYNYYAGEVHPNFILYDLWFIAIYVVEIVVRWSISIWQGTYPRWYLYPFIHWYDVVGCIPVGAFRWLRLLRLFPISAHLHKMHVIDLTQTFFYKFGYRLYSMFVEEITDRVFIILLDSLKKDVVREAPDNNSLAADAIRPHQQELAKWLAHRIQTLTEANYTQNKDELRKKIDEVVTGGLQQSEKLRNLMRIPFVGKKVVNELGEALSDASFNLLDNLAKNIYLDKSATGLETTINNSFDNMWHGEKDEELDRIIKDILVRAIERVKSDIRVKIWQVERAGG